MCMYIYYNSIRFNLPEESQHMNNVFLKNIKPTSYISSNKIYFWVMAFTNSNSTNLKKNGH